MIAKSAGCISLYVDDPLGLGPIRCHVLYPSSAQAESQNFGHYQVALAIDAEPPDHPRPQVLISHGNGGTPWTHRDLAVDLARHGYVVVLPEHRGNCVGDNGLAGSWDNLIQRPRQLSRVLDAVRQHPRLATCTATATVDAIGHSLGAYTVLAAAGGLAIASAKESPAARPTPIPQHSDPRLRRLVLLAPAAARFSAPQALAAVHQPILIWAAELDALTPPAEAALVEAQTVPGQTQRVTIPGAGHFSFLSPFPPILERASFAPSQDPAGFNRRQWQAPMHQAIRQFLQANHA